MSVETFFKMFPPPAFLAMPHAGLDISDDAVRCLMYGSSFGRTRIKSFAASSIPEGLMHEGETRDQAKFIELLSTFAKKSHLKYVKVSIPEEKAYLFQTDVPTADMHSIRQNIESKLEVNVPLAAQDALFDFDILPQANENAPLRASVSVVPRSYIEHLIAMLRAARMEPISFEVVPRALAHIIIPPHSTDTVMIVHLMEHKTGIYIVSGGVVCFTSTLNREGVGDNAKLDPVDLLSQEISRINEYWVSHPNSLPVTQIKLVGKTALEYEKGLDLSKVGLSIPVSVAQVWSNVCKPSYVPPIRRADSFAYAVAAGLALPS